jgi:hypothetical protein
VLDCFLQDAHRMDEWYDDEAALAVAEALEATISKSRDKKWVTVVAPNFAIRGKVASGKFNWLVGTPVYDDPDDFLVDDLAEAEKSLKEARIAAGS